MSKLKLPQSLKNENNDHHLILARAVTWASYLLLLDLIRRGLSSLLKKRARQHQFCRRSHNRWRTFCWLSNFVKVRPVCEDKENQGQTIIFSTIPLKIVVNIQTHKAVLESADLVSPSRSLSLLFSGWIFLVSILKWWVSTFSHHCILFTFSR
jgi:hypothetical protein